MKELATYREFLETTKNNADYCVLRTENEKYEWNNDKSYKKMLVVLVETNINDFRIYLKNDKKDKILKLFRTIGFKPVSFFKEENGVNYYLSK